MSWQALVRSLGLLESYLTMLNQLEENVQGVLKRMSHSELRLLGPYRAPLKLSLVPNTPICDTRAYLGTIRTLTLPYTAPYSPNSRPTRLNKGLNVICGETNSKKLEILLLSCRDCRAQCRVG